MLYFIWLFKINIKRKITGRFIIITFIKNIYFLIFLIAFRFNRFLKDLFRFFNFLFIKRWEFPTSIAIGWFLLVISINISLFINDLIINTVNTGKDTLLLDFLDSGFEFVLMINCISQSDFLLILKNKRECLPKRCSCWWFHPYRIYWVFSQEHANRDNQGYYKPSS